MGSSEWIRWADPVTGVTKTELDVGWQWQGEMDLRFDTIGLGPMTGAIYHNSVKIGEITSDDTFGGQAKWYTGTLYNLRLKHGDVLDAKFESPTVYSAKLNVKRVNLAGVKGLGITPFSQRMREWGVTNKEGGFIRAAARRIRALLPAGTVINGWGEVFGWNDTARSERLIREFAADNFPLSNANTMTYSTTAAALAAMATLKPPTPKDIFDTWDRFRVGNWYPGGQGIPQGDEAAAWLWDDVANSAKMPLNSVDYVGFVSSEKVENYNLEVTLSSDAGDDDLIGVVLAARYTTKLETLSLLMCPGTGFATPAATVYYNYQLTGSKKVAENATLAQVPTNTFDSYWKNGGKYGTGKDVRVSIARRGSQFSIKTTEWGDPNGPYLDASLITVDLNSDAGMANLLGAQCYGYAARSQANSVFRNINFVGGVLWDTVTDAQANKVYRYVNGSWVVIPGLKISDIYGTQRKLVSQATGEEFYINADGSITKL